MTRADIFVQILSEVSGRPCREVAAILSEFRRSHPGGTWDQVIPDDEAKKLITDLRKEAPGILAWLVEGARRVRRNTGHA